MIRLEAFKGNEWVLIGYFPEWERVSPYCQKLMDNGIEHRVIDKGKIVFHHKPER